MNPGYIVWHLAAAADRRPIKSIHFVLCACAISAGLFALAAAASDLMQSGIGATIGGVFALLLGASNTAKRRWIQWTGPATAIFLFAVAWLFVGPTPGLMAAALTLWCLRTLLQCRYLSQVAAIFPPLLVTCACALTKSENLATSIFALIAISQALIAMAWSSQADGNRRGAWTATKQLFVAGIITVPLAVSGFLLFPRMPLGFNEATAEDGKSETGLSSSMTPGSVAELVRNPKLAFTASFYVETLRPSDMYWRAAVFDIFDGRTWRSSSPATQTTGSTGVPTRTSQASHYEINLPPAMSYFVPLLDSTAPAQVVLTTTSGTTLRLQPSYAGVFENRPLAGMPVKVEALIQRGKLPFSNQVPKTHDTQLPSEGNQKTRELALRWYEEAGGDTEKFIRRIRHEIFTGPYRYTLRPDRWKGNDGIDQFMFESKAGFCEHYAAAFVFMMRTVGLPARVVTGYQGGEVDRRDVRVLYRDAHAWTEVWQAEQGWVRVDPTTFIDPLKVEASTREALERPSSWKLRVEAWSQRMANNWTESVVQYGEVQQQAIIDSLLTREKLMIGVGTALVFVIMAILAGRVRGARRTLRRKPDRELVTAFELMTKKLSGNHIRLPSNPTVGDVRAALARAHCSDDELIEWLQAYEAVKYGVDRSLAHRVAQWPSSWKPNPKTIGLG